MSVISANHLSKSYPISHKQSGLAGSIKSLIRRNQSSVVAVDDVSFEIAEGELVGFIGPNGAGKTTTLKILSGLLHPSSGQVKVLGFDPFNRQAQFQKQFSLIMGQRNQLWWDLPALDSFILNKEIYEIPENDYQKRLSELVELLEVSDLLGTQVRKLSLGQRMKMELIAALLHHPKVLFLDEPTIGLDVVMQQKIRNFIREYNHKNKATIVLTSHYMMDVKELCKRVIIIDHGKIIYDGLLDKVVDRFSSHKIINLDLEREVDRSHLEKFGEVKEFAGQHISIHVPKNLAATKVGSLLTNLPVADLTIEDPSIEDIIRNIFMNTSSR